MITLDHFTVIPNPSFSTLYPDSPELANHLKTYFSRFDHLNRRDLEHIKTLALQNPDCPEVHFLLIQAYDLNGSPQAAEALNNKMLIQFSGFLPVRIGSAMKALAEDQLHLVPRYLGADFEIYLLQKNKKEFFFDDVLKYYITASEYFIAMGNRNEVQKRLDILKKIAPENPRVRQIAKQMITLGFMENMAKSKQDRELRTHDAIVFCTAEYAPTDTMPDFELPQILFFYNTSIEATKPSQIEALLKTNRDKLVEDLKKVVEDSISRYQWFIDNIDEFDPDAQEFPIHAAYWIGALNAEECLPVLLDLFRQDEDVLEYWFADIFENIFTPTMFVLAKNNLTALAAFVREPNVCSRSKYVISDAVSQIGMHYEEMKAECKIWLGDLLDFLVQERDNPNIFDSLWANAVISELIHQRAEEYLPQIKILFDNNYIPLMYMGDYEDVAEEMSKVWGPWEIDPMPENIYEYYNDEYLKRRVSNPEFRSMAVDSFDMSLTQELMREFGRSSIDDRDDDYFDDYEEIKPGKKAGLPEKPAPLPDLYKNVSRNEPCPCGSGKKFKRCHGM